MKLTYLSLLLQFTLIKIKNMKTIKLFAMLICAMMISFGAKAETKPTATKTETIKVAGNCGMCESRIEKAVKVDGVSKAKWDSKTQLLTVTYAPSKITNEKIQQKIAAIGHDTQKVKASDKAYASLPGCCKYKRMK